MTLTIDPFMASAAGSITEQAINIYGGQDTELDYTSLAISTVTGGYFGKFAEKLTPSLAPADEWTEVSQKWAALSFKYKQFKEIPGRLFNYTKKEFKGDFWHILLDLI
jgi:hypothetical protein